MKVSEKKMFKVSLTMDEVIQKLGLPQTYYITEVRVDGLKITVFAEDMTETVISDDSTE